MAELDASEVGVQAARVMEDLEQAAERGELGDKPKVVAAMVIYEVRHDGDDEWEATVGLRVTDGRAVVGHGLLDRARDALCSPDAEEED